MKQRKSTEDYLKTIYILESQQGVHGSDVARMLKVTRPTVSIALKALEHSRLRIPVLMSTECPHGHQALDGYLLPVNLAAGATFSPAALEAAAEVAGKQLRQMGVDLALVSALDVLRDPRWGRSEECFSEDPVFPTRRRLAAAQKDNGKSTPPRYSRGRSKGTQNPVRLSIAHFPGKVYNLFDEASENFLRAGNLCIFMVKSKQRLTRAYRPL